jgi:glycosyltransferase involved in cell wall biosynthesis
MHVMFIHPNFPGQFGHIAHHLTTKLGWRCTFVTSVDTRHLQLPFDHINYKLKEGHQPQIFRNPATLEQNLEHLLAVYKALRTVPHLRPDLVVGHMSYGTMLYLRNLYDCPFIGYYELLPPPFWSEAMVLRPEFPPTEGVRLFNAVYHAITYLHLHAIDAGYTPTEFQRGTAPVELRHKLRVIYDGVDADCFARRPILRPAPFRALSIGPNTRVVTYVARGLESVRGFDIFMKIAKRILAEVDDVVFLIAGQERTEYGHEMHHIKYPSFKQYVLAQDDYDLSRFHFLGLIPTADLATLYSLSDLHIYLTVPYVLSWSLMQAMAAGCTVLGSNTAPVREVLDHEVHGLLGDFYDVDGLSQQAIRVLRNLEAYRSLGIAARNRILDRYEQKHCIAQLVDYFQAVAGSPHARVNDSSWAGWPVNR